MIVVDVNVLAFYLIEGVRTREARILKQQEPEWLVPPFWLIEFESVLQKYVRLAHMPKGDAVAILRQAMDMFSPNEVPPEPNTVLHDALNWGVTVYDAQYVSLAKQLGMLCVTEDGAVQRKCPAIALSMARFMEAESGPDELRETRSTYRTGGDPHKQRESLQSLQSDRLKRRAYA